MPKGDGGQKTLNGDDKPVFVAVRWNAQLEQRYVDWDTSITDEDVKEALVLVLDQGLRITVGRAEQGFVTTFRDPEREKAGKPYALSGWGGSPWESIQVAVFKHAAVCTGYNWDTFEAEQRGARH